MCLIDAATKQNQNFNTCLYFVILNQQFYALLAVAALSLYVTNNMVKMFGVKYRSLNRILIELLIEFIYCFILNPILMRKGDKLIHENGINVNVEELISYFNIYLFSPLMAFILLDTSYYLIAWCHDKSKDEERGYYIIMSTKVFQIKACIIIMIVIYHVIINSFSYYSCIQGLQYSTIAGYLFIEPFFFVNIE